MKKSNFIYLTTIAIVANVIILFPQSVSAQLPKRVTGLQLKSPFGMSIAGEPEEKVAVGNDLGIKWVRGTGSDFTRWDGNKQEIKDRITTLKNGGIMPLNICFYPSPWLIPGKLGPPADMNAYVEKFYNMVDAAYELSPYFEHWNEPWVDEWAWNGGSDQLYRDMIKQIWNRVKPTYPNAWLIGGGSTAFNRDIMYPKGNTDMGYADGSICHAYGFPNNNAVGTIANQLELDKKYSKSKGIAGAFQTEFGTYPGMYATDKLLWVGRSVAPSYLSQMLAGFYAGMPVKSFWFNYGSDGDFSIDNNTVAKNAIRTMTLILEGTKITADAYPKSKAINGIVFANDYSQDTRTRATIYVSSPYVGGDATARDPYNNTGKADMPSDEFSGTVSITNSNNMQAYDFQGNRINDLNNIPMVAGEVVYLLANMTSDEMKKVLDNANFSLKNEIKVTPLSMDGPVVAGRTIDFKFENLVNKVRNVNFSFTPPSGFTMASTSSTFDLQVGEIRTIRFKINSGTANAGNLYNLNFSAATNGKTIKKNWVIQSAYAPKKTINVDGNLGDWGSIAATTMGGGNYSMRLAWDDNNLYFAAEIADDNHAPYPVFKTNDFEYFRSNRFDYVNKDGIIMAFDVMKNNPDDLLKNYANYEKACAADVDYQFFAQYAQGNKAEIIRYQAPGSNYQGYYPLTPTSPAIQAINATTSGGTDGKVNFSRSGNKTIYEGAIAWNTIPELRDSVKSLGANGYCDPSFAWKVNSGNSGDKFWTTESGQMEDGTYGFYPAWISGQFGNGGRVITRWSFINGDGNTARTATVTSVNEGDLKVLETISIHPNPAKNELFVTGKISENTSYTITTLDGKTLQNGIINSGNISIENLKEGIYLVKIKTDAGEKVQRFVKE